MDKIGLNAGQLIGQTLLFVLLLAAGYFSLKPVLRSLESRAARIKDAENKTREAGEVLAQAKTEAEGLIAEARTTAARLISEGAAQGEAQCAAILDEARKDAEREYGEILERLRPQFADIVLAALRNVVAEGIDETAARAIINSTIAELPDGARQFVGDVDIVSALPLDADEQSIIRASMPDALVSFAVDPRIIGGLIVKNCHTTIDASVARRIASLGEALTVTAPSLS